MCLYIQMMRVLMNIDYQFAGVKTLMHILKTDDNFWEIGKGPGGPDSEIFFHRGRKNMILRDWEKNYSLMKWKMIVM